MKTGLHRYEAQEALFARDLSRPAVLDLDLPDESTRSFSINVWRNHNFETLIPLLTPYCRYGRWSAQFHLGAYDDSLMFSEWRPADLELLWLDSTRFSTDAAFADRLEWMASRLTALRGMSKAPIVLATWTENLEESEQLQAMASRFAAVHFADLRLACEEAGVELIDRRTAKLAGTPLSKSAQLLVARELACRWLPAVLLPPIKALALDLDHTLHLGVLGEEGAEGVQLTPGHLQLQEFAKSLRQQGIFIALVSRNERQDVEALFAKRQDYPLRWDDFSVAEVSWGDKSAALERVAQALRISIDAVLFVDDNPGELSSVTMQLPQAHTAYAHPDAGLTRRVIGYYPGLWRWKLGDDDAKRILDLKANAERESLAESVTDPVAYLREMQTTMVVRYKPIDQLDRLADLCKKTNQFNLAMRRLNAAELSESMGRRDACVASVQLKDRLSDSGVIAVIVAERQGQRLQVVELCVSCRALGRHMEDSIVLWTLLQMPNFAECSEVAFAVQHGPRNQPALDWLARLIGRNDTPSPGIHVVQAEQLIKFQPAEGVTLIKE